MKNVVVKVGKDEWYPVFYLPSGQSDGVSCEVSPIDLERYNRIFAEFTQMQDELETLYRRATKR